MSGRRRERRGIAESSSSSNTQPSQPGGDTGRSSRSRRQQPRQQPQQQPRQQAGQQQDDAKVVIVVDEDVKDASQQNQQNQGGAGDGQHNQGDGDGDGGEENQEESSDDDASEQKNPTDPIFHRVRTPTEIGHYSSIFTRLKASGEAEDNDAWKREINKVYQGIRHPPPFPDLASMTAVNILLRSFPSAVQRIRGGMLEWKEVVNEPSIGKVRRRQIWYLEEEKLDQIDLMEQARRKAAKKAAKKQKT